MIRRRLLNLIVPDRALRWRGPVTGWSLNMALKHFYVPIIRERLIAEPPILRVLRGRSGGN